MKPACFLGGYRYYSHYVEKLPTVNVQTVETPRLSCRLKRSTPTSKCLCWQYHIAVQEATGGNRAPCAFPEAQDTSIPAADTRSNWAGHRRPHPAPPDVEPPATASPRQVSLRFPSVLNPAAAPKATNRHLSPSEPSRPADNRPAATPTVSTPSYRRRRVAVALRRGTHTFFHPHPHTHTPSSPSAQAGHPSRGAPSSRPKLSPRTRIPFAGRRDEAAKAAATERQSHRRESLNSTAVHRPTTPPPWARRTGRRSGGPPRPCGA